MHRILHKRAKPYYSPSVARNMAKKSKSLEESSRLSQKDVVQIRFGLSIWSWPRPSHVHEPWDSSSRDYLYHYCWLLNVHPYSSTGLFWTRRYIFIYKCVLFWFWPRKILYSFPSKDWLAHPWRTKLISPSFHGCFCKPTTLPWRLMKKFEYQATFTFLLG